MNKERLNDLLKEMHTCDDTRKEEIKKEIYNAYVKPVLYVCKNVLSDDYDYEQYADDSFTMAFGNVEKNNIELGADFVKMLNIATIYTCSMKLSSSPEYLDWTKSKATKSKKCSKLISFFETSFLLNGLYQYWQTWNESDFSIYFFSTT